jgi:3-oxoadipate enol-lactonase
MHTETTSQCILEREGCLLHYWLTGPQNSPLVVFTHGATADHRMFDPQVAPVAQQYRVLTWDVRGHGLSRPMGACFTFRQAVEDLIAILDQLECERAVFVGQSMGGNITQEVAFLYPERVAALVAIDCTCNTLRLTALERLTLSLTPLIFNLYPHGLYRRQAAQASSLKPQVRSYLYEAFGLLSKAETITIMTALAACLHYEPGYRVVQPELLLLGDHDGLGNIKKAMPLWAARDPQCCLVMVPNAGHVSNMDHPDFVNQQLLAFLQLTLGT